MNPWAMLSLISGITNFVLAVYVLSSAPKRTLNRLFSILAMSLAVWGFAEFGGRTTTDPETVGLLWLRVAAVGWCLMASFYLHFVLVFLKKERILKNPLTYLALYTPPIIFLYLSCTTSLIFKQEATKMYWGYVYAPGELLWTFAIYYLSFFIFGTYLLVTIGRKGIERERKQAKIIIGAVLFILIIGTATDIALPMMGFSIPELAATSCMVCIACIAYAILKYKLFIIEPLAEELIPTPQKYTLEKGLSYLVKEEKLEKSYDIFHDQVTHDISGLSITKLPPEKVRERYKIAK